MLKKYFIAGLLVWLPLIITIWIIELVVGTLDRTIDLLPPQLQPQGLFGVSIHGAGAVFALVIILVTGVLAANFLGRASSRFGKRYCIASRWFDRFIPRSNKSVTRSFPIPGRRFARPCWCNTQGWACGRLPSKPVGLQRNSSRTCMTI